MEWWIGFLIIVVIIAVLWWLLNRKSGGRRGGDSPESLDHAPSTFQHGFSDIGQQAPATFSNHDASRPSSGPGLGGAAAMHRDEAAARHDRTADGSARSKPATGSSRVRPAAEATPEGTAAGADEHRQGSGVDPATENSSGDHTEPTSDVVLPPSDPNDDDSPSRSTR